MSVRRRASGRAHYNYFRDYDPAVGRYAQSDPIGLIGGLNSFLYADGNSLSLYDPYGLWVPPSIPQPIVDALTGFGDGAYQIATLGFGDLGEVREVLGIDGGVDECSSAYENSRYAGNVAGAVATGGALARQLFRPGGWANANQYLRMGFGRKGGNETFRIAGKWLALLTGRGKIDIWTGGRL